MKGCEIAFSDRGEAGRLLAARLASMKLELPVVYALPRGGVPVALEISRALQAPLDLVMVRKIGAPFNPEVALGAVAEGTVPQTVLNESVRRASGADDAYIERSRTHELAEMERRRTLYLGDRARVDPTGRTAILVDDGLATGATMKAALAVMQQQGAARIVVALPVAPEGALAEIESLVDDVVCLNSSRAFRGVGDFFADFHQLTDEETIGLLRQGWGEISPQHSAKRPANGGA
jgi:predicted phosphoribosyltransferase